ncbi:MAG: GAF domain-containing protein [Anaerolineales bacterium]|nr:GAF domain-containing protein [Anaerolineales bacterium]
MTTSDAHSALLAAVQQLTASALPLDDLLARIVAEVGQACDYIDVGVLLEDPANPELLLLRASNYAGFPDAVGHFRQPKASGLIGRALRSGQPVLVADVTQEPDYLPLPGVPIVAELVLPVRAGGALRGVLNVESLHPITPAEAAAVTAVAALLGTALEAHAP